MGFDLKRTLGFNVNRSAFLMSDEIAARFKAAGYPLSAQDFGILNMLRTAEGISQAEIAARMMRDKTTITRRLDGLVSKGFIERCSHPQDRRVSMIHLTRQGQQAITALITLVEAFQEELLGDIPAADREATLRTLQHITEKLSRRK